MTATKSGDPLLDTMRFQGIPVTRENYLMLEYMGKPPKQLHPEAEQELPEEIRGPDDILGGQHPINGMLCEYPLSISFSYCTDIFGFGVPSISW